MSLWCKECKEEFNSLEMTDGYCNKCSENLKLLTNQTINELSKKSQLEYETLNKISNKSKWWFPIIFLIIARLLIDVYNEYEQKKKKESITEQKYKQHTKEEIKNWKKEFKLKNNINLDLK